MTRWTGAALMALTLISSSSGTIVPVAAASLPVVLRHSAAATDVGARRLIRHRLRSEARAHDRPYPHYYDRPYYYAPAPFVPFNFGEGFDLWWQPALPSG